MQIPPQTAFGKKESNGLNSKPEEVKNTDLKTFQEGTTEMEVNWRTLERRINDTTSGKGCDEIPGIACLQSQEIDVGNGYLALWAVPLCIPSIIRQHEESSGISKDNQAKFQISSSEQVVNHTHRGVSEVWLEHVDNLSNCSWKSASKMEFQSIIQYILRNVIHN